MGIVIVEPILYPNTLHRLSLIKQKYKSSHYLASGDEYYAGALAVRSKLMRPSEAFNIDKNPAILDTSHASLLPKSAYDACLKNTSFGHVFSSRLD
jgi:hypothetical protein